VGTNSGQDLGEARAKEKVKAEKKHVGVSLGSLTKCVSTSDTSVPKQKAAKVSELNEKVPWRAPMARMY
jgi:hypothetical protein